LAKKPDLEIFERVEKIPEKNQEVYKCVCGEEFKALWRYQLHLQQCKIAKLIKQLKKKEPEKLKELAKKILVEMGEEIPSEEPKAEEKSEPKKAKKPVAQPREQETQPRELDDDELIEKIQELYQQLGPGGAIYDTVNKSIYNEPKPARVLQQVANDLMAQTREILQELLARAKYRKELF